MEINVITKDEFDEILAILSSINSKIENLVRSIQYLPDEWLDNQELSKLLHVSTRTLQNYRDKGLISFSQIGSKILYKRSEVEDFLQYHHIKSRVI